MRTTRKIIKVFLASPGDLRDERIAAHDAVEELNRLHSERWGYHIELVGWEDVVSQSRRPQEAINRDLDQCELFIGMLWERWGSPPDVDSPYTSGFEEEFERSVSNQARIKKPEIALLFKAVDVKVQNDPGDQLKKVIEFRDRLIAEKKIFFETFEEIGALGQKVRAIIVNYVYKLIEEEDDQRSRKVQESPPDSGSPNDDVGRNLTDASDRMFSNEGALFVQALLSKSADDTTKLTSVEVARFRLLGAAFGTSGNDTNILGVHDANLLFAHRSEMTLGSIEITALFTTGLNNFSQENTPVWHWLIETGGNVARTLSYYSVAGPDGSRVGALKALTILRQPLATEMGFKRRQFVTEWLSSESPQVRSAALQYLAACGLPEDLPHARDEFDRANYQTKGSALDALLKITSRESRQQAITLLYDLQPESVDVAFVELLFANGSGIETTTLKQGLDHRNANVRAKVATILEQRNAIDGILADKLLADSNADVRYCAMLALYKQGRRFSSTEARSYLVKRQGGLLGSAWDHDGESKLELFLARQYRAMDLVQLEKEAEQVSVFNIAAWLIHHDRQFKNLNQTLREAVDDQFEEFFKEHDSRSRDAVVAAALEPTMREFLRKRAISDALTVICRHYNLEDLIRVRKTLRSGFVDYDESHVDYLKKYGEWEDIHLLIEEAERLEPGMSLLGSFGNKTRYRKVAAAMISIADDRVQQLIELKMSPGLLSHVLAHIADRAFSQLSDLLFFQLFTNESDQVRKAAVLKCIRSLPKSRLSVLQADYLSLEEARYYNVVHWLDFGVSLERARTNSAAKRIIESEWLH